MTKSEYSKYLASRKWFLKKNTIIKRSQGICERCKYGPIDHVHHLTYERIGDEKPEDLIGLCEACHAYLHGKSDIDPAARREEEKSYPILEKWYGNDFVLLCPKCGENYTHVKHVFSMSGYDEFEGGPDKNGLIYGVPPTLKTSFRRNGLRIDISCEQDHEFSLILQQHKGQTFVTAQSINDEDM